MLSPTQSYNPPGSHAPGSPRTAAGLKRGKPVSASQKPNITKYQQMGKSDPNFSQQEVSWRHVHIHVHVHVYTHAQWYIHSDTYINVHVHI